MNPFLLPPLLHRRTFIYLPLFLYWQLQEHPESYLFRLFRPPRPTGNVLIFKTVHPVPHPDEICRPRSGQFIQGYYVVFRGRECGIYYSWYVNFATVALMY
jgi:hypothetical protein